MASCDLIDKCLFFNDNLKKMPAVALRLKDRFCMGDKSNCARYLIVTTYSLESINADPAMKGRFDCLMAVLYPNELEKAHEFIKNNPSPSGKSGKQD